MTRVHLVLTDKEFREVENRNNRLDYYEIAMTLLYAGTNYQRRSINTYMRTLNGDERTAAIKEFIDMEIIIGRVEVY